jgi:hypothetical protein
VLVIALASIVFSLLTSSSYLPPRGGVFDFAVSKFHTRPSFQVSTPIGGGNWKLLGDFLGQFPAQFPMETAVSSFFSVVYERSFQGSFQCKLLKTTGNFWGVFLRLGNWLFCLPGWV